MSAASIRRVAPLSALLLFAALPAAAQEPAPSPTPEPPRIDVTGFVDAYYTYNYKHIRGDFTDSAFFANEDGGLEDSQHAFILGVVYSFGGKI